MFVTQNNNNGNEFNASPVTAAALSAEYPRLHDGAAFGESRALQGYSSEVKRVQGLAKEWAQLVREATSHCAHGFVLLDSLRICWYSWM